MDGHPGRWPCLWQVLFEPTAKASLSSSSGTKDYLVLKVLQDARAQAQRTAEDSTVPPFPSRGSRSHSPGSRGMADERASRARVR